MKQDRRTDVQRPSKRHTPTLPARPADSFRGDRQGVRGAQDGEGGRRLPNGQPSRFAHFDAAALGSPSPRNAGRGRHVRGRYAQVHEVGTALLGLQSQMNVHSRAASGQNHIVRTLGADPRRPRTNRQYADYGWSAVARKRSIRIIVRG